MSTHTITGLDPKSGRTLALSIENGVISRIEQTAGDGDFFLTPGFIDLQVNGYCGFDVNAPDVTPETIRDLAQSLLERGVTCFAPTLITASELRICRALQVIAEARRMWPRVAACIPYVHVEGPHVSAQDGYRGAHPASDVRPPSIEEFKRWQNAGDGIVGMVTMSPHFCLAVEYIAALTAMGVLIAIGHTQASAEQIRCAVDAGARLSTHLGNGMAAEIPRHSNPLWPQLAEDRLTASFIADGHHLPADMLKVMLGAKGPERAILVSDSVALAGMPAGVYDTPVGGHVVLRPDGRLCLAGSELLAGATSSLPQCIGYVVRELGLPLHEALQMATSNPGRFAGGRGQLKVGARADAVRFRWDDKIVIEDVWLGGERLYVSGGDGSKRMGDDW